MNKIILSFYDYTTEAVKPWADAGYDCYCYDIQHTGTLTEQYGAGTITRVHADLHSWNTFVGLYEKFMSENVKMVLGFPVCTDMAVSGARHFKSKAERNPEFQNEAVSYAKMVAAFAIMLGVPYAIENPVSVLATMWRKPDHSFHPYEFGGYIPEGQEVHPIYPDHIAERDAYTKKTCLWTGGGFVMPETMPVECESYGASRQYKMLGGKSIKTKNIRSATPRGFAIAAFEANK